MVEGVVGYHNNLYKIRVGFWIELLVFNCCWVVFVSKKTNIWGIHIGKVASGSKKIQERKMSKISSSYFSRESCSTSPPTHNSHLGSESWRVQSRRLPLGVFWRLRNEKGEEREKRKIVMKNEKYKVVRVKI